MSEQTKIQWTDHTFNPWIGCTKVSPGCAEVSTPTRTKGIKWGAGQPLQRTSAANWKQPVKWNKWPLHCLSCGESSKGFVTTCCGEPMQRRRVSCGSLSDWLDDEVPIEWLADLLTLIHDTPKIDWQLPTKQPENFDGRMLDALNALGGKWGDELACWVHGWKCGARIPNNVWIGTTVEDQERADLRIPALLKIPAKVHFLSCEPLLGEVDIISAGAVTAGPDPDDYSHGLTPLIDWVIVGGESGPKSRACNIGWIRSLVAQCKNAGLACFVKQIGSQAWHSGLENGGTGDGPIFTKHSKGGDMAEWPADLRVREFPR